MTTDLKLQNSLPKIQWHVKCFKCSRSRIFSRIFSPYPLVKMMACKPSRRVHTHGKQLYATMSQLITDAVPLKIKSATNSQTAHPEFNNPLQIKQVLVYLATNDPGSTVNGLEVIGILLMIIKDNQNISLMRSAVITNPY